MNVSKEEEIRDGYLVTKEQKALWNIQLDILSKIISICEKHNIKYFAAGGTLLGAARHKGYIPWDDDIDLGMLLDDYLRFIEIAKSTFSYPYYVQSCYTSDTYGPWQVKIRRSDTTFLTKWEIDNAPDGFDCGVFVDIFCYYNIPDSVKERATHFKKINRLRYVFGCLELNRSFKQGLYIPKSRIRFLFVRIIALLNSFDKTKKSFIKLCEKYNRKETNEIAPLGFSTDSRFAVNSHIVDEIIIMPFENGHIACPKDYDAFLTKTYGDWHVFVKGTAFHFVEYVDLQTPYNISLEKIRKSKGA